MRHFFILFFACVLSVLSLQGERTSSVELQRILGLYTETLGGVRSVEALSSMTVEGVQIQGGQRFDFSLSKKRPDSIRYRFGSGQTSIVCGYNGRLGWERREIAGQVTIADLPKAQVELLRSEANFDSPLFRYLEKSWNAIEVIGIEMLKGSEVYVLEVKQSGKPFARYYLHSSSGLLLQRTQFNADGSTGLVTEYRDYRDVDGYQLAYEVENRLGDELVSLIKIDEIEVNPGLLSFYFEKPTD